ncbi:Hypothetical predicted protein, partial [Marmota monax]
EHIKAESAEATKKMLEEIQRKNAQIMEQKEKSYQEHVHQLTEKMQQDRAQAMGEQERTPALKFLVFDHNISVFSSSAPSQKQS